MPDTTQMLRALLPMLSGEQLKQELADLPAYTGEIREKDPAARLLGLSDLYRSMYPPGCRRRSTASCTWP